MPARTPTVRPAAAPRVRRTSTASRSPAAPKLVLLNRERSILEFNRRVLAQTLREDVPLLERLRYVCIVSSNLDEFFEVRFADVLEAARLPDSGITAREMASVVEDAHALIRDQYSAFNDVVMPALKQQGIFILNHAERDAKQRAWVDSFFQTQVRPLLMPVSLDPSHPFPQVANKALNFIMKLGGRDAFGRENRIAILKVPRVLPRVIRLPAALCKPGEQVFVMLSSVIRAHLAELFPGREVEVFSQFRVTRDSDLEVDEEDVANLRQALRSSLSTRHFGRAIRLEVVSSCPDELTDFLLQQFELPEAALYKVNGPVNLVRLNQLIDQVDDSVLPEGAAALRFAPFEAGWPAELPRSGQGGSIIATLQQRDVLMHHPFQSFDPVVAFLREAVHDPDVLAIKQTIYRTGSESVLMELLIEAARRGKEVMAVVELKARFDEEANINWAERLEAVGAQVVYGIVGLKTHAKLMLVTRREAGEHGPLLRHYAHLSTGNYNPKTARLYTDTGFLTADPAITADAHGVFQQLASQTELPRPRCLLLAPQHMHARLIELIGRVGAAARAGVPGARMVIKINALTDPALAHALAAAGQAGAHVDLIVRGACMLPPGLPGLSENVRVRSVVGRFLEHTRVLWFCWGEGEDEQLLYLSSADWMSRNMLRRIELAWPVRDPALRRRVIEECLDFYLDDSLDAWQLAADGRYQRVEPAAGEAPRGAQRRLMQALGA
ncbi:polyphosphate kinase 1 [Piscinibacter sp. Jin2]|uniref:Polyphosphate kinase n=1 Tax=Aquariibacter lacus TaxID=2801332 RepID=A0A9X0XHV4_9BURK|nr:polyphosphate kinase 1 [Piscinibacter lacus]MBL0720238.1 polyphosphate kinase 1 [Piscinibacter lacus]